MGVIIKTNKKARDLYVKHLNKLDDYANGNFKDRTCYMCDAANAHQDYLFNENYIEGGKCRYCPLDDPRMDCDSGMRRINLRYSMGLGEPVSSYCIATPESIRKHIKWIEKRIDDKTDCVIYYE